ncbi:phage portal protein [Pseudomonas aeruginosa]|jgi:HK97 family phage portal protein|uniref:phage portal protein n=1 Tax=Pseudomonas TaxID=286 RepID=UPI0003B95948|nr:MULTISPECIES: phage portal protein [Pseudomonas]EJO5052860.1 phage portal protein [Pseudomonas aeruginosa]EKQ5874262.1 phage portal protein [Pseudomonas aeruginosa]EKU3994561.1 phage portal protein [Pseudomonas aeruginosa]ELX9490034.1 phage portal protein [Pseudomonas aeruginosa]ERW72426.1 HK97 family phage portal protein [Pseudomonas aeruginosa BWHPSA013]
MGDKKKPGRFKSALLDWLGVPIGLTDGAFWQEWFGTSASGKNVTVDKALQLSTVWACVRLLSESVSTLPLKLYRRLPDGSREQAKDHPLFRLLCRTPNAEMTPQRFMLMVVASICLRGNAFVEKKMIGTRVVALVPLLPQYMRVKREDSGRLKYTYTENGVERVIPENNLMHIRGFGLDGVCGMLPVTMGREIFGSAMSAEEAAAKVFAQGMQASGILSGDTTLTPKQREDLRASLTAFMGSQNAGKIMVAEAGLKYQGITMNPEAAQMLESRSFNVEEMCRWFRVPPFMVGHMDKQSSWASSVEAQNLHFLTNSLRPLLVNIEQEITRCLIGEADADEFFAEFAVEGLLRADSTARAAWYNTALQNGWMSRNEVRRLENLPPIEGGDVFTVQSALVPLEQLGATAGGVSPAATAYMLRLVAANESGDKAAMRQAIDLAVEALETGNPAGPMMAHALISLPRLNQAA